MFQAIAGGILGAIAGAQKNASGSVSEGSQAVQLRDINTLNQGRSQLEAGADSASMDQFNQLLGLVNAGPGASAITDSLAATNNYANQLQGYMQNGGAPSAANLATAQSYANNVFAPQQTSLNQQFYQQGIDQQRLAARLGRPGTDPVLANKLAFSQGQLQQQLDAQKTSFGAQYADQLMGRQLDLGSSLMNIRNGLATQAFNNRQTLLGLGQQLVNSERNYRIGTATHNSYQNNSQYSGGGAAGAIGGALAGFGAGAGNAQTLSDIGNKISGWFSKPATNAASGGGGAAGGLGRPMISGGGF